MNAFGLDLGTVPVSLAVARPERIACLRAEGVDPTVIQRDGDCIEESILAVEAEDGEALSDLRREPNGLVIARVAEFDIERGTIVQG